MNIFTKFYLLQFPKLSYGSLTPYIKACTTSHKMALKWDNIHNLCLCLTYEHTCRILTS